METGGAGPCGQWEDLDFYPEGGRRPKGLYADKEWI